MKLFYEISVNKSVLTYFKDVFLAGPSIESPAFFIVDLSFLSKIISFSKALQ